MHRFMTLNHKTPCQDTEGGACGERRNKNPLLNQNSENLFFIISGCRPPVLPDVSLYGEPPGVVRADALERAGHEDRAVAG